MTEPYFEATEAAAIRLFSSGIEGEICMLNLLRFVELADYTDYPQLAPMTDISGRQAYQRYIDHTRPFLEATGGSIAFLAEAGHYFVGPEGEYWDVAMMIRQNSLEDFLSFASNDQYLAGIGHRSAALRDSRILPMQPRKGHSIL